MVISYMLYLPVWLWYSHQGDNDLRSITWKYFHCFMFTASCMILSKHKLLFTLFWNAQDTRQFDNSIFSQIPIPVKYTHVGDQSNISVLFPKINDIKCKGSHSTVQYMLLYSTVSFIVRPLYRVYKTSSSTQLPHPSIFYPIK